MVLEQGNHAIVKIPITDRNIRQYVLERDKPLGQLKQ